MLSLGPFPRDFGRSVVNDRPGRDLGSHLWQSLAEANFLFLPPLMSNECPSSQAANASEATKLLASTDAGGKNISLDGREKVELYFFT